MSVLSSYLFWVLRVLPRAGFRVGLAYLPNERGQHVDDFTWTELCQLLVACEEQSKIYAKQELHHHAQCYNAMAKKILAELERRNSNSSCT